MRGFLFSIILCLVPCLMYGQDTFYYCNGEKMPLTAAMTRSVSSSNTYYDKNGGELTLTGYVYIKLKSPSDYEVLDRVATKYGLKIVEHDELMPLWYVLQNSNIASTVDIANTIYETGMFAECSPDFSTSGTEISYDPDVIWQWNLYNSSNKGIDINVSKAWNCSTGRGVVIAIVDEGIDLNHKDLADNIFPESFDAREGKSPSKIYGDHGTHCAGIAAAVRNNGIQVIGVAPDAKLMSVSDVLDTTALSAYNHARGIMWAWKHGADIISCSWNCAEEYIVAEAIDSAVVRGRKGKGCIVVKSAGNGDNPFITFPGNCYGVIAVANINKYGERPKAKKYGSNYGESMFLSAPGTAICSTVPNDLTNTYSGTSMAAPHVSGVAALMLERNPELTVWQVREILARTAKKLDSMNLNINKDYGLWNKYFGYGLVDAYEAVLKSISLKY